MCIGGEQRPALKADITNAEGQGHIPGYAGHIPGLRDRPVGSTFGHSTSPGIFNESDRASSMKIERIPKSSYHSG